MRILTFNHHESYLCSLADLGHQFDVAIKVGHLDLSWNTRARPVPNNFNLVVFDSEVKRRLRSGYYDVVICHTIKNLVWLFLYTNTRFVFIAHIPLFRTSLWLRMKSYAKLGFFKLFAATHKINFLAVSEFKRASWGVSGQAVVLSPKELPALLEGEGYDRCVVVCNNLAERGEELGIEMLRRLGEEFKITILGNNPGIAEATKPKDFKDFTEILRRHRIYIYTVRYPLGDGYNTAMLEAMRLGMAIVTVDNPSSPIVHGVNGLVGRSEDELKAHIHRLLADRDLVDTLGQAARKTALTNFSEEKFLAGWQRVL